MKLNKKIVAGLATAALFAPLALNNVQVHANDKGATGENSSIDKSKDKSSQLNQYLTALGASSIPSDKLQNILSNLSQISNSYKEITQNTTNYQKDQFNSLLNNNNNDSQNHFINSFSKDNAQSVVNDISSKFNDSEKIKNEQDNYSPNHYKAEQLKQTLTSNDKISTDNINDSNVNTIINNIEDIKNHSFGGSDDFINDGHNTDGFINNTSDSEDVKTKLNEQISNINRFKDSSNTSDSYKAEQLKQLFNDDDKVNKGNIDAEHVQSILASIKSINSSKSNIENPTEENKKDAFKEVLKQNNLERDTDINLDELNTLTIGDRLSTINDIQSHTSSPAKPTVVVNNNNNSNSNNTNQSSKPTETNNSHEIQFPSAPKSDNVVKDSHATKVNNAKSDVKKAEKQLANAKSNKAKNNAVKSINKAKANLVKLNGDQKSALKDAKKSVKKAEKQVKKAKTSDARKSATTSLKAAQTNYTQLNKYIK